MSGGIQYNQDLPPKGGYEPIRFKRNLPGRGPSGLVIFAGTLAICGFGFYRVGQHNLEKRELQRENTWSRIHLVPLLMAEGDRDVYRRTEAQKRREAEIMKDVKGWEPGKSVYNSKRYASQSYMLL